MSELFLGHRTSSDELVISIIDKLGILTHFKYTFRIARWWLTGCELVKISAWFMTLGFHLIVKLPKLIWSLSQWYLICICIPFASCSWATVELNLFTIDERSLISKACNFHLYLKTLQFLRAYLILIWLNCFVDFGAV